MRDRQKTTFVNLISQVTFNILAVPGRKSKIAISKFSTLPLVLNKLMTMAMVTNHEQTSSWARESFPNNQNNKEVKKCRARKA